MKLEITEAVWTAGETGEVSLREICVRSGLSEDELRELVANDVLAPIDPEASNWRFDAGCVALARSACRLRADLDLEPHGLAIVLRLLERVRALESEVAALRARMPEW